MDSICSSNPKKASKSGKAENILPAIQKEYDEHLTNLSERNLEKDKLSKDVTAWGKRKGGLLSAHLGNQADEVGCLCTQMTRLLQFLNAEEAFDESRDAA